jgi:hypothetical protein
MKRLSLLLVMIITVCAAFAGIDEYIPSTLPAEPTLLSWEPMRIFLLMMQSQEQFPLAFLPLWGLYLH